MPMKMFRAEKGFSLIEMMVAMVAGLIVIGAVVVFTVATAQSSTTNIHSVRVMQNLRTSLSLIEREIRRSGYNQRALAFAGQCVSASGVCPISGFNTLAVVNANCLVVSYDNSAKATAGVVDDGEFHRFRLAPKAGIGVIQASLAGSTAPNCDDDATWQDITDPNIVDVTDLTFTRLTDSGGCIQQPTTLLWIVVQDVRVQMTGQWIDPATKLITTRGLDESVRVKNDVLSLTLPAGICT
jgi:prepilin-type N-terminal cleavage/methylation domain-containing protein